MTQPNQPCLPIPPSLEMSQPGTFAHYTLTHRWGAIAHNVISDNSFSSHIVDNLERLINSLPNGIIRPLEDKNATDTKDWNSYLQPYLGKRWIEIPWFPAETYFYRRILEATEYFQNSIDPFQSKKQDGLAKAIESLRKNSTELNSLIHDLNSMQLFLYNTLWGNQADLSLNPNSNDNTTPQAQQDHILVDDTVEVIQQLENSVSRIDIILDNTGSELLSDLYLIDFLISNSLTNKVYLHFKAYPTFVSDATIHDFHHTRNVLARDSDANISTFGQRLNNYITSGQLQLRNDFFWTFPLVFWEMPETLRQDLAKANLVILKGDANYRRLLGDCAWSYTTPLKDITCYFPAPFVALRSLKSEVVAGLSKRQIQRVSEEDSEWLVNGKWGVIQLNSSASRLSKPFSKEGVG